MSKLVLLSSVASGDLAVSTARRPCPPGSRVLKLSARPIPLRGIKEEKRKNVNVLLYLQIIDARSGCTQLGLLQIVQSGHQKSNP